MMDDVLVHGSTREEHDARLRDVLNRLQTAGMILNESKCQFAKTSELITPMTCKLCSTRNIRDMKMYVNKTKLSSKG